MNSITIKKRELKDTASDQEVSDIPRLYNKTDALSSDLIDLQTYLLEYFPGATLIPSREGGKIPLYKHKNGQYTSEDFLNKGHKECHYGCLIILPSSIIVIDVDDEDYCHTLEESIPDMTKTVTCKTSKGRHYYFQSTTKSKDVNMQDGARQLKASTGEAFPIDIKTLTSSGTGGVISIPPSPNKRWLRKLGNSQILPLPDAFVEFYIKHTSLRTISDVISQSIPSNFDKNEIISLVTMLSERRANNYDEWIKLGWCLHNIDANLLEVWDNFSKKGDKYKPGECRNLWMNMREEGLNFGSLCMWAKHDNPEEYKKFQSTRVFMDIKNCNGSHHSIAKIAHKLYNKTFVCASSKGKQWYYFNGTLWEEDPEALKLRKELSTSLRDHFLEVMVKMRSGDDDNLSSISSSTNTNQKICENLLKISFKLEDCGFKDCLIKEMREQFYDKDFLKEIDANPNLIAFTNGVWDLKKGAFRSAHPEDKLCLSVGYPYIEKCNEEAYQRIDDYFKKLHPIEEQRTYIIKTLARQLYGDNGFELFHIHAGHKGSAGNGKSRFFEVLELALGDYVHKFAVETLVLKQRGEANRPFPELQNWRGRRILYCSEPNADDKLNSGVMKELTGGEKMSFRLLFSNETHKFKPMYKMHIMCNDTPQLDGSDQGVKRRIRKLDYVSRFVDASEVDELNNKYLKDMGFSEKFQYDCIYRMEMLRYILNHYDHTFAYEIPNVIKVNSGVYLDDNNKVLQFIKDHIESDCASYFTLKQAKDCFRNSEFYDAKINLKTALEKVLETECIDQKKIKGVNLRNVFFNFKLKETNLYD